MDEATKLEFQRLWRLNFGDAELPLTAYYTDETSTPENEPAPGKCLIADLNRVRGGEALRFGADTIGCPGGKRYTGFSDAVSRDFEYFLSCGVPGRVEGERYKRSPELVRRMLEAFPRFKAPKRYIVFKRWDQLSELDEPEIVVFFASPDVLSGLFTLANYDMVEDGVVAPFGSGCSSIVMHPYLEGGKQSPRCVLGMFDPSVRPHVDPGKLTFAIPMKRFTEMTGNMPESFLTTPTWKTIRARL